MPPFSSKTAPSPQEPITVHEFVDETRRCVHFGECGGCRSQDVPYAEQLAAKARALEELMAPYWTERIDVEPSPVLWHYRNKIDPNFGRKYYETPPPKDFERETVLGFKHNGQWFRPLEIEECLIGPEGVGDLLAGVRAWMKRHNYPGYDTRRNTGFLRTLLVRDAKRTGERMVVLITSDGDFDRAGFVEAIRESWPATSVYRGIFRGNAELAAADEMELIDGSPTIDEALDVPGVDRRLHFRLSPFSFFQTNTLATERLYGRIREWVQAVQPHVLYDLYGGAGGIAFSCADLVDHVESVESVESATLDGRHNAEVNGIDNVRFHTHAVEKYLRDLRDGPGLPENCAMVLDPPRAGLHPKAIKRLLELRPPHMLYVACKPSNFIRELPAFLEDYRIDSVCAVDLFPHTPHVEMLTALSLR
jgi:23S rRNA (uracil1939-C5)-methyltransferase